MKANPDDNTLKANPALCKHTTTTTIKTTAQIMHNSDKNYNNNTDTSKMQYFVAMHDCYYYSQQIDSVFCKKYKI